MTAAQTVVLAVEVVMTADIPHTTAPQDMTGATEAVVVGVTAATLVEVMEAAVAAAAMNVATTGAAMEEGECPSGLCCIFRSFVS